MGLASGVISERLADGRLGLVLSGSYFNHQIGSDNIEAVWNRSDAGQAFVEEFDVRRYDVQRVRRSVAGSLDFQFSPGSMLTWRSMYNHRDDWENRYSLRYVLGAPGADGVQSGRIRRQTKGGIDDSRVRNAPRRTDAARTVLEPGVRLTPGAAQGRCVPLLCQNKDNGGQDDPAIYRVPWPVTTTNWTRWC